MEIFLQRPNSLLVNTPKVHRIEQTMAGLKYAGVGDSSLGGRTSGAYSPSGVFGAMNLTARHSAPMPAACTVELAELECKHAVPIFPRVETRVII